MFETVLAFVLTIITILVPVIAGIAVLLFLPILGLAVWRILAWRRKQRRAHEEKLRLARERIALAMAHRAGKGTNAA
jgi:Flp pilus assembly protein TadB